MRITRRLDVLREHPNTIVTTISRNIYFLNQAYKTHCENYLRLLKLRGELAHLLDFSPEKSEERRAKRREIISAIHNYLSSYYSLKEAMEEAFKDIPAEHGNLAASASHIYLGYADDTAFLRAVRTCVQHRKPLDLEWIAEYSHSESEYYYSIGFWLSDIVDARDWSVPRHAQDEFQSGTEYHFGDVEGPFVNFFDQAEMDMERTHVFYEKGVERICEYAKEDIEEFDEPAVEGVRDLAFDFPNSYEDLGSPS